MGLQEMKASLSATGVYVVVGRVSLPYFLLFDSSGELTRIPPAPDGNVRYRPKMVASITFLLFGILCILTFIFAFFPHS